MLHFGEESRLVLMPRYVISTSQIGSHCICFYVLGIEEYLAPAIGNRAVMIEIKIFK